jgi:hypothetical protein
MITIVLAMVHEAVAMGEMVSDEVIRVRRDSFKAA